MSDPNVPDDPTNDAFDRALFASGRGEAMGEDRKRALFASLGVGVAASAVGAASTGAAAKAANATVTAAKVKLALLGKWALTGIACVTVAASGAAIAMSRESALAAPAPSLSVPGSTWAGANDPRGAGASPAASQGVAALPASAEAALPPTHTPTEADPTHAGPGHAGPGQAGPRQAAPSQAGPGQASAAARAEPASRAVAHQAEPALGVAQSLGSRPPPNGSNESTHASSSSPLVGGAGTEGASSPAPAGSPADDPAPASRSAASAPSGGVARSSLAEEIVLLEAARAAVRRGALAEAESSLAAHSARFPRGVLVDEASVVHVDLLVRRGDREAARREATAFVKAHPLSPHAPRLRVLTGDAP